MGKEDMGDNGTALETDFSPASISSITPLLSVAIQCNTEFTPVEQAATS